MSVYVPTPALQILTFTSIYLPMLFSEFVEPVQFDLGRIFSECGPSQPIVFTVKGRNQAKSDIRKFASEKERELVQLSMGSNDVSFLPDTLLMPISLPKQNIFLGQN